MGKENEMNGNILAPVNWLGNGTDFFLTNADAEKGGLMDGHGDIAVVFPDDGHPVMCCEAIDLLGDSRDELVVWDYHSLYIYTQENEIEDSSYHPVKYPVYNASNYRGEYSFRTCHISHLMKIQRRQKSDETAYKRLENCLYWRRQSCLGLGIYDRFVQRNKYKWNGTLI